MTGKHLAAALTAIAFVTVIGRANAEILSLRCTISIYGAPPGSPSHINVHWIDLSRAVAVTRFDPPANDGRFDREVEAVTVSPESLVLAIEGQKVVINRFNGEERWGNGGLGSCVRTNIPLPPDAPPLTPKF